MLHPATRGHGGAGDKAVLQGTMLPLHHAICLRVVRGRQLVGDAQRARQLQPQIRSKLTAPIGDDGVGDTKTGNPMAQEGPSRRLGSDVGHRHQDELCEGALEILCEI